MDSATPKSTTTRNPLISHSSTHPADCYVRKYVGKKATRMKLQIAFSTRRHDFVLPQGHHDAPHILVGPSHAVVAVRQLGVVGARCQLHQVAERAHVRQRSSSKDVHRRESTGEAEGEAKTILKIEAHWTPGKPTRHPCNMGHANVLDEIVAQRDCCPRVGVDQDHHSASR